MAFVFDGPSQTARMINLTKKTYVEMTKADMEQMKQQMDAAMAQVQAQLQNLPPAQRQMAEQMMRGRGGMPGGASTPATEYRQTGSDRVGQLACTKYEGYVAQQKTAEICTADPKEFGLTPADFEVALQLAEFMKNLVPEGAERLFVNGSVESQGFSGIPVKRTSFRNGAVESVSELTEFRRETFAPSTFEVPADFRREAMPGIPR